MADCKNLDLARQWAADIDADRQTLSQDTIDAAADLISSLPDAWVGADTLRKYIADWREGLATAPRGNYEAEMLDDLEDMLPAPKPRTLADMPPEEQEACRGMQAEVLGMQMWLIVGKDPTREGWWIVTTRSGRTEFRPSLHIVPLPELPRMQWPGSEPEDDVASATGGELTTQDVVDECRAVRKERAALWSAARAEVDRLNQHGSEYAPGGVLEGQTASPRPEDVPVGEMWQVEIDGQTAIGYRNDPYSRLCWTVVYRDGASYESLYDDDVTLAARLVPETAEQDPPADYGPYTRIEDIYG